MHRRIALLLLTALPLTAHAFTDTFDSFDNGLWGASDGWSNGSPFAVGWRADHLTVAGGLLTLSLDDQPCASDPGLCSGMNYASAELRSNAFYGYGTVSGQLQAASGAGLITSLFTYTGAYDGNPHDEIDIEILGQDTTKLQVNYYVGGVGGHEAVIDLGFDAAAGLHEYAFSWRPDGIDWYVDGLLVHSVDATGPLPTTAGKIMANLWAVDSSAEGWAGAFAYDAPVGASYSAISYTPFSVPEPSSGLWPLLPLALWGVRRRRQTITRR